MLGLLVNIDVDDLDAACDFYTRALGLRIGRRLNAGSVELLGAPVPLYLLANPAGSAPYPGAESGRSYRRHWSPLHLDFVVSDLAAALERAQQAGAKLEGPVCDAPYGLLARLSDPFGHGFCLLEFRGGGYDELARLNLGAHGDERQTGD